MNPSPAFDVFRLKADGGFLWVGCADTMRAARVKVTQEMASKRISYLIVDSETGEKTVISPENAAATTE